MGELSPRPGPKECFGMEGFVSGEGREYLAKPGPEGGSVLRRPRKSMLSLLIHLLEWPLLAYRSPRSHANGLGGVS